ncbi:MAG: hypothetical protein JW889_12030 [Verrucomicrobia bacterium]|nr:hypothetical protein [Verrucomicrobiota bacterium]
MQPQHFEPMTVGQILDRTFKLYRDNFARFLAIVAVIYVPIALATIALMVPIMRTVADMAESAQNRGGEFDPGTAVALFLPLGVMALLSMLAQALCNAALIKSVSESYLGRGVTVGQAYAAVLPRLLPIIGASILVAILCAVGLVFCVVPGVIFWLWFLLTMQTIVVEKQGAVAGMRRSKSLMAGNLGKGFGLSLVIVLITWIANTVFQRIGGLVVGAPTSDNLVTPVVMTQLFSIVGQMLVMPIGAGAYILLYYDLRIRKEGFDLQLLAQAFGTGVPPADGIPPVQM